MDQRDRYYRFLRDQSDKLSKLGENLYGFYDKAILYLSAGGIALSISFVKDIIGGDESIKCVLLLKIGWVLWMTTILAVLISYIMAQRQNKVYKMRIFNEQIALNSADDDSFDKMPVQFNKFAERHQAVWSKRISCANWTGIVTFFSGIFAVIWFAWINT